MTAQPMYDNDCYGCVSTSGNNGWYCTNDNTCWSSSSCGMSSCFGSSCVAFSSDCDRSLGAGAIVGIIFSILFVIGLIMLCVFCARRRNQTVIVQQAAQPVAYVAAPAYPQQAPYQAAPTYPAPQQGAYPAQEQGGYQKY